MRPRLLFLCQQNPWRLSGGALIRNYWIARALTNRFDVDLVTADDETPPPPEYGALFRSISGFARPRGKLARIRRAAASLRPGSSLLTAGTVTPALRTHLARSAASADYRAVMYDLNMLEALPPQIPRIYHAHNCETLLLRRRAAIEKMPTRLAVTLDAKRFEAVEAKVLRDARLVIACSQADVADFASLHAASVAMRVVPNGVDVAGYASVRDAPIGERVAVITGSYDWRPNQLGLEWFTTTVLPELDAIAAGRPYTIRVAGRMSTDYARKLAMQKPLELVPNPPEMKDVLAAASVVVAPIIASSGTRLRILEAWAAGRPVVTTSEGAFGLDFADGSDIIVRSKDDPKAFARALWTALDDPAEQRRIAAGGLTRSYAYDWPALGDTLVRAVEAAVL
ncbi:MAG: glycosyltransferase [Vulcanimicrobiaceae bacterium]